MKPKPKAKKRKPTDATMRNVRAANRKLRILDQHLTAVTLDICDIWKRLEKLERKGER